MKFDCGPDKAQRRLNRLRAKEERITALSTWRRWFAWYPVRVGSDDCRWLEVVDVREHWVKLYPYHWKSYGKVYRAIK